MKYQHTFFPITATPFSTVGYNEVLPCRELLPYVRCFWTSDSQMPNSPIIPDLCADIMIHIESNPDADDEREITCIGFCGVSDKMFVSQKPENLHQKIFGIRLYAWQAQRFADERLSKTANDFFDLRNHFESLEKILRAKIFPNMTLCDFQRIAEPLLLSLLNRSGAAFLHTERLIMDAISTMIRTRGSLSQQQLLQDIHASERQLERIFEHTLSLSPKKISSIIRYQSLWQEVCRSPDFDIQDSVFAYGYFDQAHLLNDFRKFHGMSLSEARTFAFKF